MTSRRYADEEWRRIYGSPERAEWIEWQSSVASGQTPCENAHIKTGGTGRKADYIWIVPLTWEEHRIELHTLGRETFEAKYKIDLDAKAIETERRWQDYLTSTTRPAW